MKKLLWAFLVSFSLLLQAEIPLAKDGKALAEIIINKKSDKVIKFAASELQHWIKEISGARLPIVDKTGKMKYKIFLQVNPAAFKKDLIKMQGNDGYAVRTKGNNVYIFAEKSKGILNGVFKMLFKNSDIIWARPNTEFGTFYSKNPNFSLNETNYIDIPVYILRGWQMIGPKSIPSELWQVRNGNNWSARTTSYKAELEKLGNVLEYGGGHNLVGRYITPGKYFKTHPDFFPMIEGKRRDPRSGRRKGQLCFTNPAMTKAFIKEIDDRIKKNPDYGTYRIMIEDDWILCECPKCLKDIKLKNGKVLKSEDKSFRSTQFFMFLNQIARYLQKKHPGKNILTFGYFFTEIPPACKLEKNISISFCPIFKNSKLPMDAKGNKVTNLKFLGWLKITTNLTLREYYGLTGPFPRPVDAIAIADWRYANKLGINKTYSEMYADLPGSRMNGIKTWDVNSLYFWTMTNASWNPYQDVNYLRKEFLKRVYGPAAKDVSEFYRLTEKGWHAAGGNSLWSDKSSFVWRSSVREQNIIAECRAALERAARKIKNPKAKKMLAGIRKVFERQISLAVEFSTKAKRCKTKPVFDPDFKTGAWENAEKANNFVTKGDDVSREKTCVKILYDDKKLYFGVKCFDKHPEKAFARSAKQKRDRWPAGDKFELFVTGYDKAGKITSNQIVFDINGNIFDTQNQDTSWNPKFDLKRKISKDGWSAMLTLPFKEINVNLSKKPKVKVMFVRYWNHRSSKTEVSFWEQGIVHNYHSFGNLIFN